MRERFGAAGATAVVFLLQNTTPGSNVSMISYEPIWVSLMRRALAISAE